MGYGTRDKDINTYWPDDTDDELYLDAGQIWSLTDIQAKIDEKWPGSSSDRIRINTKKFNTDCVGHDLYDSSNYTNFIIISKV